MVQKTINAKAKVVLRSSTMVENLDAHYRRGYHLSYNISSKLQTQGFNSMNFFCFKKLKPKDPKLAPSRINATKSPKQKHKKDKKKRF